MSLYDSQKGSPLDVATQRGRTDVLQMMEEAIRCKESILCDTFNLINCVYVRLWYRFQSLFVDLLCSCCSYL